MAWKVKIPLTFHYIYSLRKQVSMMMQLNVQLQKVVDWPFNCSLLTQWKVKTYYNGNVFTLCGLHNVHLTNDLI